MLTGKAKARALRLTVFSVSVAAFGAPWARAEPFDPAAPEYAGRRGVTLYVSKAGDDSDGTNWSRAFRTIQKALSAVPDDRGGHRILIRPDRYVEANLFPAHPGAKGSWNLLAGDADGAFGSGAKGWVLIDTGVPDVSVRQRPVGEAPGGGNPAFSVTKAETPETGLKAVDWWGPWRCDPTFSAIGWDRWIFRGLYATGSEGGMGWDLTTKCGSEFSALVEDCVGIGRFAGGAAIGQALRPGEPVVFRRSWFACLDVWGDAGGVYVRSHDPAMPEEPGVIFDDCTIVAPDNALQVGYPKFEGYSRVRFRGCRLIVLNFSQPHGTPSTGIIYSDLAGKFLHVELEDCALMGYKVFGALNDDLFGYSLKGRVSAYVHYRQPVPEGFERTPLWPADLFQSLAPPEAPGRLSGPRPGASALAPAAPRAPSQAGTSAPAGIPAPARTSAPAGTPPPAGAPAPGARPPELFKLPLSLGPGMEQTPVVYGGRPLLVGNFRDDTKDKTDDYTKNMYLLVRDLRTGAEVARFGEGHSFASAFARGPELHVFASEGSNHDWFQSIWHFTSADLKTWKRELAIAKEGGEHLFNASVCEDDQGYVMAYESNVPVQFCFKFARSKDLSRWEKLPGLVFTGVNREYSACPALRYIRPWYHAIYLHEAPSGQTGWVSFAARSRDLAEWELSPRNPILVAGPGEGINNSDVDLFEYEGRTYLFYATGDQATWSTVNVALYPGTMAEFFESLYPEGVPRVRASVRG